MGSHYGAKIRKREESVLKRQRALYECPKCGKKRLKRRGYAKWECKSCGAQFAGGAYVPETTVGAAARKMLYSARAK